MTISDLENHNYIPYSNEGAVAVVQSREGDFYPGVRVENIAYPLTIPATQNALFCCLSEGQEPRKIFASRDKKADPFLAYWSEETGLPCADLNSLDDVAFSSVLKSLPPNNINKNLQELLNNPHVEQSDFPVSALLETEDGYISGINIETRDWSRGLCAERVALAKALAYGISNFKALHITTLHGEYNSPCGACRQVILEHLPHQPVYLYQADGTRALHFSSDLLPYSFQSSTLKKQEHTH